MFCPNIKAECIGQECRDWDQEAGGCRVSVDRVRGDEISREFHHFTQLFQAVCEESRFNNVLTKLALNQMISDPTVDPGLKDVIKQALAAPTSEVAEKLLKDAGLLDSQ